MPRLPKAQPGLLDLSSAPVFQNIGIIIKFIRIYQNSLDYQCKWYKWARPHHLGEREGSKTQELCVHGEKTKRRLKQQGQMVPPGGDRDKKEQSGGLSVPSSALLPPTSSTTWAFGYSLEQSGYQSKTAAHM